MTTVRAAEYLLIAISLGYRLQVQPLASPAFGKSSSEKRAREGFHRLLPVSRQPSNRVHDIICEHFPRRVSMAKWVGHKSGKHWTKFYFLPR
jgi:hypothetical protein